MHKAKQITGRVIHYSIHQTLLNLSPSEIPTSVEEHKWTEAIPYKIEFQANTKRSPVEYVYDPILHLREMQKINILWKNENLQDAVHRSMTQQVNAQTLCYSVQLRMADGSDVYVLEEEKYNNDRFETEKKE
eukprot:CAMPEP_0197063030 /NCGR_PEP_ID=MMETSP1384-20130603/149737_1 /TAXON_ID=29189 /ORGANISM="Ammonia sp." /LENGTH=131 /DNA_ID=CAMNT_0042499169 /DNA_START=83 /DNA_END=475 /DNA_ORIENTATION=+